MLKRGETESIFYRDGGGEARSATRLPQERGRRRLRGATYDSPMLFLLDGDIIFPTLGLPFATAQYFIRKSIGFRKWYIIRCLLVLYLWQCICGPAYIQRSEGFDGENSQIHFIVLCFTCSITMGIFGNTNQRKSGFDGKQSEIIAMIGNHWEKGRKNGGKRNIGREKYMGEWGNRSRMRGIWCARYPPDLRDISILFW